jgi:hypothetical protein
LAVDQVAYPVEDGYYEIQELGADNGSYAKVGSTFFKELQTAVSAFNNGSETELLLTKDVTDSIELQRDAIVDLGGHTLTGNISGTNLTVTNGTVTGTVTASGTLNITTANTTVNAVSAGIYNIIAGTYGEDVTEHLAYTLIAVENENGKYVVQSVTESNGAAQVGDVYYRTVEGAVDALTDNGTLVLLKDAGSINIPVANATVNLNDKTITGDITGDITGTNLNVTNGTVTGNVTGADVTVTNSTVGVKVTASGTLTITDANTTVNAVEAGTYNITAGTYGSDVTNLLTDYTRIAVANADGKYVVGNVTAANAVAQIGETYYRSLNGAAYVADGNAAVTITLLKDTAETVVVNTSKTITLNLNGKTLGGTLTNEGVLTINGGENTGVVSGVIINKHDLTILSGKITKISNSGSVTIVSGLFKFDPSAYVADETKTGVRNTDEATMDAYPYTVGAKVEENEADAEIMEAAEPEVSAHEDLTAKINSLSDKEKEVVNAALDELIAALTGATEDVSEPAVAPDVVSGAGLADATEEVAAAVDVEEVAATKIDTVEINGKTYTDMTVAEILTDLAEGDEEPEINVFVQPYIAVEIKDIALTTDESGAIVVDTIKVEIKAMVKTIATTAETADEIETDGANQNAIEVGEAEEMTVTSAVTVSVPLPSSYTPNTYSVGDDTNVVFVKHIKTAEESGVAGGLTYIYKAILGQGNVLSFVNLHGFSEFEIGVGVPAVYVGEVGYETLGAAIADIGNNSVVTIGDTCTDAQTLTVTQAITFSVTGKTELLTVEAGSGYTLSQSGTDTITYTITRRSYSSGGGSSSSNKATGTISGDAGSTTSFTAENGITGTVTTDTSGAVTEVSATIPADVAKEAAANGTVITIPVENLNAAATSANAPKVSLSIPAEAGTVKVEIPVTNVSSGVVAILVNSDGSEQVVKKSTVSETGVVLAVSGDVTVKIVDNTKTFGDIADGYWGGTAVTFVSARGIFNGTGDGSFSPNLAMSRGMLAQVLYALDNGQKPASAKTFGDVSSDAWYADAVAWAAEQGIVSGYPDGTFGANDSITREQLALMLWNYAGKPEATQTELNFNDASNASSWAQNALLWANEQGIINGKGEGNLDPTGLATRAEVAQMIMKYLSNG